MITFTINEQEALKELLKLRHDNVNFVNCEENSDIAKHIRDDLKVNPLKLLVKLNMAMTGKMQSQN